MKRFFSFFLIGCLTFCADKNIPEKVQAKIITWDGSKIAFTVADFKYLTDPRHMDGTIAAIRGGSVINANATMQDIINNDVDKIFFKKGSQVNIDYLLEDDVIILQNFDSTAMLTVYHHFEQVVDFLIKTYGFTLQEIGKFNIHYSPSIEANEDDMKIKQTSRLNAAYIGGLGDFLLFKTSRLEEIPFKMNPAIIAHEFGHKVFDIRFAQLDENFMEAPHWASNQLSGINEGFADFISWLFVQQTDLYLRSLNVKVFQDRVLPVSWTSSQLKKNPFICAGDSLGSKPGFSK